MERPKRTSSNPYTTTNLAQAHSDKKAQLEQSKTRPKLETGGSSDNTAETSIQDESGGEDVLKKGAFYTMLDRNLFDLLLSREADSNSSKDAGVKKSRKKKNKGKKKEVDPVQSGPSVFLSIPLDILYEVKAFLVLLSRLASHCLVNRRLAPTSTPPRCSRSLELAPLYAPP